MGCASAPTPSSSGTAWWPCGSTVTGPSRAWELPKVPELDSGDYYPMHPHSRMLNRVKVHPQVIVENAADPYHIAPVHHGDRPAETTSFEFFDNYIHATVDVNYGGGRPSTWLTPDGPVDGEVVYDTFGLGIGFVRFPAEVWPRCRSPATPRWRGVPDY